MIGGARRGGNIVMRQIWKLSPLYAERANPGPCGVVEKALQCRNDDNGIPPWRRECRGRIYAARPFRLHNAGRIICRTYMPDLHTPSKDHSRGGPPWPPVGHIHPDTGHRHGGLSLQGGVVLFVVPAKAGIHYRLRLFAYSFGRFRSRAGSIGIEHKRKTNSLDSTPGHRASTRSWPHGR